VMCAMFACSVPEQPACTKGMQGSMHNSRLIRMPQQDFCCNYIGQEVWLNALDWERASEWQAAPAEVWDVDGERAGTVQAAEPLTYVKLDGAGHMVCFAASWPMQCMVPCTLASQQRNRYVKRCRHPAAIPRAAAGLARRYQLVCTDSIDQCKGKCMRCCPPLSQTASDSLYPC